MLSKASERNKVILVTTRPVWVFGKNSWNNSLQTLLNPEISLLSLPSHTINLVGKNWLNKFSCLDDLLAQGQNKWKKRLILFTSPNSVEALFKVMRIGSSSRVQSKLLRKKINFLIKMLSEWINRTNILTIGAIGKGTALKFEDEFLKFFKIKNRQENNLLENIVYSLDSPSGVSWVGQHMEFIRTRHIYIMEGKENSTGLSDNLKKKCRKVCRVKIYSREKMPIHQDNLKYFTGKLGYEGLNNGLINFLNERFVVLMTTSTNLGKNIDFFKELIGKDSLEIITHHKKIVDDLKKLDPKVPCTLVDSLSPKAVASEINKLSMKIN